jgi:hypothetical protein
LGVRRRGGGEPVLVTVAFGAGETIFQAELLLDARVPKVLDLIVCSSRQMGSNLRPPGLSMSLIPQVNGPNRGDSCEHLLLQKSKNREETAVEWRRKKPVTEDGM